MRDYGKMVLILFALLKIIFFDITWVRFHFILDMWFFVHGKIKFNTYGSRKFFSFINFGGVSLVLFPLQVAIGFWFNGIFFITCMRAGTPLPLSVWWGIYLHVKKGPIFMLSSSWLSVFVISIASRMSLPNDSCVKCDSCHQFHWSILPKNFKIKLQPVLDEDALSHPLNDAVLDTMFIMHSYNICRVIQTIIGEDLFSISSRTMLIPSNLVSIFLSNAMELIQSTLRLEIIAIKVVQLKY